MPRRGLRGRCPTRGHPGVSVVFAGYMCSVPRESDGCPQEPVMRLVSVFKWVRACGMGGRVHAAGERER